MEWWEYVGDFARGALCGDLDFWEFCDSTSLAFVSGAIAMGVIAVGDVRDTIAGVAKGDFVSAGISVAGIIPVGGDVVKGAKALSRFLRETADNAGPALRYLGRADHLPGWARIQALDEAFDGAATALKNNRGLSDEAIFAFARRGMSPAHVTRMLDNAADVRHGAGTFTREIDAENLLRQSVPDAVPNKPGLVSGLNGERYDRFLDITNFVGRRGYEVKFGKVHWSGRARQQLDRDVAYLSSPDPQLHVLEWHFYANRNGVAGPDEGLLQALIDRGIPYVIHLP